MELLEHVSEPALLLKSCAALTKPGGHLFFSTLNRHPKAYLFAILGAEYLLRLIEPGTHDYGKFIRPSELEAWASEAGLELQHLSGFSYNPWSGAACLSSDLRVNYLAHFRKKDV